MIAILLHLRPKKKAKLLVQLKNFTFTDASEAMFMG